MKNPQEIEEIRSKLNSSELVDLEGFKLELEKFLDTDEVSLDGLTVLENMVTTLGNFRRNYTQRVLRLMKQAHLMD